MTNINIRKAKQEESPVTASLIALAMYDILFQFIGEASKDKALHFLINQVSEKGNQYSYENCWVAELDNEIVAAACLYDGACLQQLRKPVAAAIKQSFGREFSPEDETQAGEYYIDSIGVSPLHQGNGIGTRLFRFLIDEYVFKRKQTLGLLVDKENPEAKKLYIKLGFKLSGEKTLVGKAMKHLQYKAEA
jgi:ribosomal protein S18 acetylase RimI-like enzyme